MRHVCKQPRSQANCLNHALYALVIMCIVTCQAGSRIASGFFLYGLRHQMQPGGANQLYSEEWFSSEGNVRTFKAGHEEDGDLRK